MKTLILLLFAAGLLAAPADDSNVLRNGDFSDGVAHWEGDCHSPDSASVDLSSTAPASGVVVKLRHGEWTKMKQDFDGKAGDYILTISYTLSPDLKFSDKAEDYSNVPAKTGYSRFSAFDSIPGAWVIIVCDLGAGHFHYWKVTPNTAASTAVQTVKSRVQLNSDDSLTKAFCLVFPPGDGFITLQNVSLTSKPEGTPTDATP